MQRCQRAIRVEYRYQNSERQLISDFERDDKAPDWADQHPKAWGQEEHRLPHPYDIRSFKQHLETGHIVAATGGEIHIWESEDLPTFSFKAHSDRISGIYLSPDGRWLLSGCSKQSGIRLWDLEYKKAMELKPFKIQEVAQRVSIDAIKQLNTHPSWSSASDTFLLSSTITTALLKYEADREAERNPSFIGTLPHYARDCFTLDSKKAFYRSGNTIIAWDIDFRQDSYRLAGHTDAVMCIDQSSDGKLLLSASWDKTIRLWNTASGERVRLLTGHRSRVWIARFSNDCRHIFSGAEDTRIFCWDVETGTLLKAFPKIHTEWVRQIAISPDDSLLASGGADGSVALVDISTGQKRALWRLDKKGNDLRTLPEVSSLQFSHDGSRLLFKSCDGFTVVYDIAAHVKYEFQPPGVDGNFGANAAFSQKGDAVLDACRDNNIRYWKL